MEALGPQVVLDAAVFSKDELSETLEAEAGVFGVCVCVWVGVCVCV